jgi:hypothetical protein
MVRCIKCGTHIHDVERNDDCYVCKRCGRAASDGDGFIGQPCYPNLAHAPKEEKQSIEEIVADIVKTYQMYEYIDFVGRSSSAKGTINWAEEVARFLVKECPDILSKFPLYAKGEYERGVDNGKGEMIMNSQGFIETAILPAEMIEKVKTESHAAGVEEKGKQVEKHLRLSRSRRN